MNYRKYFEGHVSAGTTTNVYKAKRNKMGPSTVQLSQTNPVRNKVLGDAIVSTLKDCGLTDAYYDETCCYVYLDKKNSDFGFYVYTTSSSSGLNIAPGFYGTSSTDDVIQNVSGTGLNISVSASMFNNTSYLTESDYKFYVTVKGDTAGAFILLLGSYSNPAGNAVTMYFFRGVDKRNEKDLWGFCSGASVITNVYWVFAESLTPVNGTSSITACTAMTKLTLKDEWVVLIEMFMNIGFIVLKNTFIDPGFGDSDKFYEIDGEIYYCFTPYLVKCITPVTTGGTQ